MKVSLIVNVGGFLGEHGASIEVPDSMIAAFEPIKTTDDPMFYFLNGEKIAGSQEVKTALKFREDSADRLAQFLSNLIIDQMKKNDTHNGYKE